MASGLDDDSRKIEFDGLCPEPHRCQPVSHYIGISNVRRRHESQARLFPNDSPGGSRRFARAYRFGSRIRRANGVNRRPVLQTLVAPPPVILLPGPANYKANS